MKKRNIIKSNTNKQVSSAKKTSSENMPKCLSAGMKKGKLCVWLVDDLEKNRTTFKRIMRSTDFHYEVFSDIKKVFDNIKNGNVPDALLCDIFFYPTRIANTIEKAISEQAQAIRKFYLDWEKNILTDSHTKTGHDKIVKGIVLAQDIVDWYKSKKEEPPFPIFAYTSKGPYILQTDDFSRIEKLHMRWFFKRGDIQKEEFNEYADILTEAIKNAIKEHGGNQLQDISKIKLSIKAKKIFIVHGHDDKSAKDLYKILKTAGLEPIILEERVNEGKTIIEKLETQANEAQYAFILLTPDDLGGKTRNNLNMRARQNVIMECGYFYGKLGRHKVCCLYKENTEIPSNLSGIAYLPFKNSPNECKKEIFKELNQAGIILKQNSTI